VRLAVIACIHPHDQHDRTVPTPQFVSQD